MEPTLKIPGSTDRIEDARQMHFEAYSHPIANALDWLINSGKANQDLCGILRNFHNPDCLDKNLLTGSVDYLETVQSELDKKFGKNFGNPRGSNPNNKELAPSMVLLKDLFNYDAFGKGYKLECPDTSNQYIWTHKKLSETKWGAGRFVEIMGDKIRYCPYCNADTIYAIRVRKNRSLPLASALDHFLPRSIYPYFGLSLYNLVPSCARCNSSLKSSRLVDFATVPNPYRDDYYGAFSFRVNVKDVLKYRPGKNDRSLYIKVSHKEKYRYLLNDVFALEQVYNHLFKHETAEILARIKFLRPTVVAALSSGLGLPRRVLNRLLLSYGNDADELLRHRHAKLALDLVRQFKR